MFGLLRSVADLAAAVLRVAAAPAEIVSDLASPTVEPIAEVKKDLVADVESLKG